jgi:hypothetical protein
VTKALLARSRSSWMAGALALALGVLSAGTAEAYTVKGGDLLVRPVVGASVNVLRLDVATRATPPAGMLVGVEADYAITGEWNVAASLREVLAPGFLDTQLGLGAKYRLLATEAPLIPYASLLATFAFGAPLRYGDAHLNVGARLALGTDYFVMRDLAVGAEVSLEPSFLAAPLAALEVTAEALVGLTYRF